MTSIIHLNISRLFLKVIFLNHCISILGLFMTSEHILFCISGVSLEGSVLTIVCMSTERYFAIRHPMKVRRIFSEQNVKIAIVGTWVLAIIIMCPLVIYRRLKTHTLYFDMLNGTSEGFDLNMLNGTQEITSFCIENWPSHSDRIAYDIFLLFIVYIIPGFIVVVLYSLIGCSLCRQNFALNRANSIVSNDIKVMAGRRKLARMMIIISVLFALCWLPYFIVTICFDFNVTLFGTLPTLYPFALLLAHSHSAQNPILYCFMHRGFNDFLVKLVRCQFSSIGHRRQVCICMRHNIVLVLFGQVSVQTAKQNSLNMVHIIFKETHPFQQTLLR